MVAKMDNKKILASALVLALLAFLVVAIAPYISAVFSAMILAILFMPFYEWLLTKKLKPGLAATVVIIVSMFIILIPMFIVFSIVISEIPSVIAGAQQISNNLGVIENLLPNIENLVQDFITRAGTFVKNLMVSAIGGATQMIIGLTIMYFLLFYFLVHNKKLTKTITELIPFNKKHSKQLMEESGKVSKSVIISTGLIAVSQGILMGIGFWIFGVQGAVIWGIVTVILGFIPVLGAPIIWIPAGIILIVSGNTFSGVGLMIYGTIVSNADNFVRPGLQRKFGEMHPLVSLIGVFIGIPYFGILGVIIGPLILSYLVLAIKMYNAEYL